MNFNNYYNMGNVGNVGNVGSMNEIEFCPDCPTQTIYDPPITQYENYYHPQLVNVVQNIETIKQHHCCPVYKHIYTHTEKNVMVSGLKRGKHNKAKKRSK
ncbi:hypothetical protein [Paenibacillus prosopidis]|uniref:Spore coat protein D n=1 Tax=Paenibacillus prosopidis TaxID=630520 RepID=A0A368VKK8_9BACL|nr:hypothetical protein [Paenibacillus prosopidis]RCW41977.1 hypothetical protein DFP97_120114 [Paenibacillus prosopidis]